MDRLKELNLLFLEDNEEFAKNTSEFLNIYFKKVLHTKSIKSAHRIMDEYKIDIIISDVRVDDGNGLDFIQELRDNDNTTPVVILSSYKNEDLLLQAIPLHILSYELKPLSYDKLINLLKKISTVFEPKKIINISKTTTYNYKTKEILHKNKAIALTKTEINFIEFLLKDISKVVTPQMIQVNVWENKIMSDSAIKNLILRLRKKINNEFILSVQGLGYRLG